MSAAVLTDAQRELARHALGLDGRRKRSYRNYFCTGEDCSDHADWMALVAAGLARRSRGNAVTGGDDVFRLALPAAQAALRTGETLDLSDFPAELRETAS